MAVAQVRLWGQFVGALAEDADGVITFEYEPKFRRSGLEISPEKLPLSLSGPISFPELRSKEAFMGLPGVLADSLPDRFGNAVIKKYFATQGRSAEAMSPVQRLLYVGKRAMGALEYHPALATGKSPREKESLEIARLVEEARKIVEGSAEVAVPEIMKISSSAGGARAKAVILWNRDKKIVRSAFAPFRHGDEHWIIKFDGVGELDKPDPRPQPFNRIEYTYARMAREAGIDMPDMELLEERRLAHLMVKRFDRVGDKRIHMHSLGGMEHADYNEPRTCSYEQYFRVVLRLKLGYKELERAYRRAVFNVLAVNQDDHVKNLSFLMERSGQWRLSPGYDLTYAKGAGFTREHQMTLAGKTDGFTMDDLLNVGSQFDIDRNGAGVIEEVSKALTHWPKWAAEVGVPADRIRQIGGDFRLKAVKGSPLATRGKRPRGDKQSRRLTTT